MKNNEAKEIIEFIQNPMGKKNNVTIQNQTVRIKEYKGQRVVTFADVESVHQRKAGIAGRNFRNNKSKFIQGIDYFEISKEDVAENFSATYGFSVKAPKGILLTESGYLMIVKSFTDELSWNVQRELVNAYFKVKGDFIKPVKTDEMRLRSLAVREMNARTRKAQLLAKLADKTAIDTYKEVLIANAANEVTGQKLLPLPQLQDRTYTAGEIGKELGISGKRVGMLTNKYQLKIKAYGEWFADNSVANHEVQTFRYYHSVVDKLREIISENAEVAK